MGLWIELNAHYPRNTLTRTTVLAVAHGHLAGAQQVVVDGAVHPPRSCATESRTPPVPSSGRDSRQGRRHRPSEVYSTIMQIPPGRRCYLPKQPAPVAPLPLAESQSSPAESSGKVLESPKTGLTEVISEVEKGDDSQGGAGWENEDREPPEAQGYSGQRHQIYSAAWEEARRGLQG